MGRSRDWKPRTPNVGSSSPSDPSDDTLVPPTGYALDRFYDHIDLEAFGKGLQTVANALFSNGKRRSKYTHVSALLLSWEDEDPQLPVSIEIAELKDVLESDYGFNVQEWQIPAEESHIELNSRVLRFLEDSSIKHLKIVYYAGHGIAIWTRCSYMLGNCLTFANLAQSSKQSWREGSIPHCEVVWYSKCSRGIEV